MIAKTSGPGQELSQYRISDREMPTGSTLGSPKAMLIVKATGALEKVYSPEAGQDVFGALVLHHWERRSGIRLLPQPGQFIIHPYAQEHVFALTGGIEVHERIFLLSGEPAQPSYDGVDPPAAYYTVELRNESDESVEVSTYASLRMHGGFRQSLTTQYDPALRAFLALDCEDGKLARLAACSDEPASYEITDDIAKASSGRFPGALANSVPERTGDATAIFHFDSRLGPGEERRLEFALTFSLDGESAVRDTFARVPHADDALERTRRYYDTVLDRASVMTPDVEVNRGALWAKANMLRCEQLAQQGWCFVNDPTRSNNSVARDTAWFAHGSDLITPHFARDSLVWYLEHLRADGMVVEYFDIRNGESEDYELSVNDDTPLTLIAVWHHYCVTADRDFLERVYPQTLRAARALLGQRDKRGLVFCRTPKDGAGTRGIAGWRNVIKGYRLAGATTELNAESYAALITMANIAQELSDDKSAERFRNDAAALREAINAHLLDSERRLYYLTIDEEGRARTDITCDLVFPVLFGVADHDVATHIIATLSHPEFWTDAGLHTIARDDIQYSPARSNGLLGGVWGGPTFWFAAAAAPYNPSFMAYALSSSFRYYAEDPRRNNTVPGQFCEWLHGEALTNQGMMLSPWFPPKYLWAAVESAAGLKITISPPDLEPHLPGEWQWIAVRNVMVRGTYASWFTVRCGGELISYASHAFPSVREERRYDEDVTGEVRVSGDNAACIALRRGSSLTIMIGNTLDRTITTSLSVAPKYLSERHRLRWFNSLVNEWHEERDAQEPLRRGVLVDVARHGFCVVEIKEKK